MGLIAPTLPEIGAPNSTEDADVRNCLQAILNLVNGGLDATNAPSLAAAADLAPIREAAGINSTGVVRRGKSIIAAEETRADPAFGPLTTPDQVANVVLPTDGLLAVGFHALWKSSVVAAGQAAIFLNGVEVVASDGSGSPSTSAAISGDAGVYGSLVSYFQGLRGISSASLAANESTVTTGQYIAP